jgi:hypothetical protein
VKVTHTVAHARQSAPLFLQLAQAEIKQLRQLQPWVRWLYVELVALSDFTTGLLSVGSDPRVSYAKLAALLAHDQTPGAHAVAPPSHDQIRRGLETLEGMGLVSRNTVANEGARALFLAVEGRKSAVTSSANRASRSARPHAPRKPSKNKDLPQGRAGGAPEGAPGVSEGNSVITPYPQKAPDLSTGTLPRPPEPDSPPGPISVDGAGPKFVPPRGQDSCPAQAGHAPRPTPLQAAMRARLKEQPSSAPPGGQEDAPQGATAPSARLRRPINTVLSVDGAESGKASAPAGQGAEAPGGATGGLNG